MHDKTESFDDIKISMMALQRQRETLVRNYHSSGDHQTLAVYDRTTYFPLRKGYRKACADLGHRYTEVLDTNTGLIQTKCGICGVGVHGDKS